MICLQSKEELATDTTPLMEAEQKPVAKLSWMTRLAFGAGLVLKRRVRSYLVEPRDRTLGHVGATFLSSTRTHPVAGTMPTALLSNVIAFYATVFLLETAQVRFVRGCRVSKYVHSSSRRRTSASLSSSRACGTGSATRSSATWCPRLG